MQFILPKVKGEILMVSGFQSREFGLVLGELLTTDILMEVITKKTWYKIYIKLQVGHIGESLSNLICCTTLHKHTYDV